MKIELDNTQRDKIQRFMSDKVTSDTIRYVIERSFLKPLKGVSVHELAAARLAVDMLDDAWEELRKSRAVPQDNLEAKRNPGV